jgi:hypothetical protein
MKYRNRLQKKCLNTVFVFLIISALLPVLAHGAIQNIYIDPIAVGSGTGTIGSPYSSFAQIPWSAIKNWVAAGDNVFINLKRGSEFRESLVVGASGAQSRPITIQPYGEGAKPIINGSDNYTTGQGGYTWVQVGSTNAWYLSKSGNPGINEPASLWHDGAYYTRGTLGALTSGKWAWGDPNSLGYNTVVVYSAGAPTAKIEGAQRANCIYVENKTYLTLSNLELKQNGNKSGGNYTYHSATMELYFTGGAGNIIVEYCDIHDSGGAMTPITAFRVSYVTVRYCNIYNHLNAARSSGQLITFDSGAAGTCSNWLIQHNTLYNNLNSSGDCIGNSGSWVGDNAYAGSNNVYEYNDLSLCGSNGIYNRSGSNNNILRYNYFHDIPGIAVQLRDNSNRNKVYNNIVINCTGPIMQSDGLNTQHGGTNHEDETWAACDGNEFWNNTIYSGETASANAFHFFGKNTNLVVKNNVVYANAGDMLMVSHDRVDNTYNGITISNNRFYKNNDGGVEGNGVGQEFIYRGTTYTTLAAMVAQMTADGYPNTVGTYGNPLFTTTPATLPVHLIPAVGSPLINNGTSTGAPMSDDYAGTPRPIGSAWDVGAYQHGKSALPRSPQPPRNVQFK